MFRRAKNRQEASALSLSLSSYLRACVSVCVSVFFMMCRTKRVFFSKEKEKDEFVKERDRGEISSPSPDFSLKINNKYNNINLLLQRDNVLLRSLNSRALSVSLSLAPPCALSFTHCDS
jgi:hypothetical protein